MMKKFFCPQKTSMKQTYLWTVLGGSVYAGSSFVMSMVTTNYLGAAAAGILALALSIGSQLVTVGYYNIRTYQVSDFNEKYSFGDYCVLRCITITAMILTGVVWIWQGGYTGAKLAAIWAAIGFRVLEAVSDLLEGRYQQKGRYDTSCRGMFVKTILYLAVFLLVLLISRQLTLALTAMAVCYLISIIVIDSTLIGDFGGISLRSSWKKQGRLLVEGLPLFVNAFLNTYIINASKYAVDEYYDSEMLGIFNSLYMMAFVVNMFSSFLLKPIVSVMAEKIAKNDRIGFGRLVGRQVLVVLALTVVCICGGYLLGIPVLTLLYGVDLTGYRGSLCLILLSGGFTALYQLFQYAVIVMRHQYSTFICCGATAALTYFLAPILTRRYAIVGASASYAISIGFMSAIFMAFFLFYYFKEQRNQK